MVFFPMLGTEYWKEISFIIGVVFVMEMIAYRVFKQFFPDESPREVSAEEKALFFELVELLDEEDVNEIMQNAIDKQETRRKLKDGRLKKIW